MSWGGIMSARIPALFGTTAIALTFFAHEPAMAQQSAQSTASGGTGLEEIVVTARRKEERLQTVPVAITAFSPTAIQEKHIESASDLQHHVPALLSSQE